MGSRNSALLNYVLTKSRPGDIKNVIDTIDEFAWHKRWLMNIGDKKGEILDDAIVAQVQAPPADDRHTRAERERLYFEAMMRVLDRELPGYAD